MWCVYLLRCADGTLYTGITNDLPRRLEAHRSGRGARYTRGRGPLALLHAEPATTRAAALRREHALKQLRRQKKLAFLDTLPGRG
jgi:putative endonuclease